jgi:hypothetical protein
MYGSSLNGRMQFIFMTVIFVTARGIATQGEVGCRRT